MVLVLLGWLCSTVIYASRGLRPIEKLRQYCVDELGGTVHEELAVCTAATWLVTAYALLALATCQE